MNKIILLIVAVSLLLLVSGCMSPSTTSTPTPTATATGATTAVATETPFTISTETAIATSTAIATGTPMGTATGVPAAATTGTPVSTIAPVSTATSTANATAAATTATINVTSYPASVQGDTNFTIQWQVTGGSPGTISNTSILWGFSSGGTNISDYPRSSAPQTGSTPQNFSATLTAPSGGGPIYIRAHAVVDGVDIYSPEQQIAIIPVYTGAGGGGGGY